MKTLACLFLNFACLPTWPAGAETPPLDLRLGHDEVRIDLGDPASLRSMLNQSALNDGWAGPLWWRAPTKQEAVLVTPRCTPGNHPIAFIGTLLSGGYVCAPKAEDIKANPTILRAYCAIFDRHYAGFPDPVKPFVLVCRKPTIQVSPPHVSHFLAAL